MNEENEKRESCCSSNSCSLPKKSVQLISTATICQEDCCKETKEIPFKTAIPFVTMHTSTDRIRDGDHNRAIVKEESIESGVEAAAGQKKEYRVHGMDCPACALTIEKAVKSIEGVSLVQVNYSTGKMQLTTANPLVLDALPDKLKQLGHTLEPIHPEKSAQVFNIEGMDCGACAQTLENHFKRNTDVKSVHVNFSTGKMTIDHDTTSEVIMNEVLKAGFTATPVSTRQQSVAHEKESSGWQLVILSGVFLLVGFLGSHAHLPPVWMNLFYALAIVSGGYKPAKSAFYAIKSRSLDMNVLMTAAVVGAAAIGQWLEGATVVWLFAFGNVLQIKSIEKTRNSINSLMDLAPSEAWVKRNGEWVKALVEEVSVGDIMMVKPGEKIPLDGQVTAGESSVNQSPITGESIPVDKQAGDHVYAGTLNEQGTLEVRVTALADDTTVANIIRLVEEAQEQKAPTQAFVDQFARIYTPIVFAGALLFMIFPPLFGFGAWGDWFYKGLELLVVACPCALVISTPVAIVSAIGNAARNGVLIKGGAFLEIAGTVQAIAFDKTGTLTEGRPTVTQIIPLEGTKDEVLSMARTMEEYAAHPIAQAVVAYAESRHVAAKPGTNYKSIVGKGVQAFIDQQIYYAGNVRLFEELNVPLASVQTRIEALQEQGHTLVLVGTNKKLLGVIAISDTTRETSAQVIQELKKAGVKDVVMLTGDNEGTARKIASQIDVSYYAANLLPEDKVAAIKKIQAEGKSIAMVGDGVNDAPALATANLGIAMGGVGTDTAMETADIVLMADHLEKLPHTIQLSRKALQVIKQNIWFALIVKGIALILIFPDLLTLWLAVLSDTGAALLVILNSMRLLRFKR